MNSIRAKLWVGMMSLVVVVLVLLWFFQIIFLDRFYTQMKIRDIERRAVSITSLLQTDQTEFADQIEALAYDNNLSIELVDLEGKTIYQTASSVTNWPMMQMRSLRSQVYATALTGAESRLTFNHPRFGSDYMLIGMPVTNQGQTTAVLVLGLPLAPVQETVAILERQLIYISLILLGATLLVSFLLARNFTGPLLDINQTANKLASGDYAARTSAAQTDEIGQLAQTINHLGEQLAQIDTLRKELIANVSHELRTPLSLIQGYAETLRDVTGASPEKRALQLGIIIDETQRLNYMVNDILNLTQLQSGQLQLKQDCFPVNELLERAAQRFELLGQQTGVTLELQADGSLMAMADEARIEQVLYNLISNGFNHVDPQGRITISAASINGKIRLEVVNTGPGIEAEALPHIWDRYYKSPHRMSVAAGTGLGLAIVKAVLEAHGAAFGVDSEKDVQTTFWFELAKCEEA